MDIKKRLQNKFKQLRCEYFKKIINLCCDISMVTFHNNFNSAYGNVNPDDIILNENNITFKQTFENNVNIDKWMAIQHFFFLENNNVYIKNNQKICLNTQYKLIPENLQYSINNIELTTSPLKTNIFSKIIDLNIVSLNNCREIIELYNENIKNINDIQNLLKTYNLDIMKQIDKHEFKHIFKTNGIINKKQQVISTLFDPTLIFNNLNNVTHTSRQTIEEIEKNDYTINYKVLITELCNNIKTQLLSYFLTYDFSNIHNTIDNKIFTFAIKCKENKKNNTFSFLISNDQYIGISYDKKIKRLFATTCVHLEFNEKEKKFHVYPEYEIYNNMYFPRIQLIEDHIVQKIFDYYKNYDIDKNATYEISLNDDASYIESVILASNNPFNNGYIFKDNKYYIKGLTNK